MPAEYTLSELARLAGVSPRTVRYYIAQGLLPSPTQLGPNARYTDDHLELLRRIRRLQDAHHLPLAEIRRLIDRLPDNELASLVDATVASDAPNDSALDYIESLLRPRPADDLALSESTMFDYSVPPPSLLPPPRSPEPDRAQWERISLDPDIELHVRRPLTRQHSKQVERLIAIARDLLKEE